VNTVTVGSGGARSTLRDLALYAGALLAGGQREHGRILSAASVDELIAPHWSLHPALPAQGLAFFLNSFQGHRIAWHDGAISGFVSSLLLAPDDDVAVIALTNGWSDALHALTTTVMRVVLGVTAEPGPPAWPTVPNAALEQEMVGRYAPSRGMLTNARHWLMFGGELEILSSHSELVVRAPSGPLRGGSRLHRVGTEPDLVFDAIVADGGRRTPLRLVGVRGPDGRVDAVCGALVVPFCFQRTTAMQHARSRVARFAVSALPASVGLVQRVASAGARLLRRGTP
jgi:hypothetical protein